MANEEKNKKIYDFLKGNIINLVILLTSAAYVFYGLVTIEPTGLTVAEVLAKAGIGIIVAFIIKECMGENGFNYGYRSDIWNTNKSTYTDVCNSANNYIERVDNFYLYEEIEKKARYRRQNLTAAQMKYDWFFDKQGNYINRLILTEKQAKKVEKLPDDALVLSKHQRKVLKKCLNVKIYNLNLFSEYGIEAENDTKRETTDKNQRSKMFRKNGATALVSAVVGAYFLPLLNDWSWGLFISSCVQVAIWISCGAIQLYSNFNYVCVEKVAKLKRKSELIVKFKRGCENGLYIHSPYDEVKEEKNESKNQQGTVSVVSSDSNCSDNLLNN